ncbi:MAG: SpoIID/LytB domain-containing protein [Acidobacteriota bacterium]|nr:SpoIID/LytB domain-containing protein [Acidobacteriota bacterium]
MIGRYTGWALLLVAACAVTPPIRSLARSVQLPTIAAGATVEHVPVERETGEMTDRPVPRLFRLPSSLRVGLATDLPSITLPCCPKNLVVRFGEQEIAVGEGLRIEPAKHLVGDAVYRLQVAALRDESQADALAVRLEKMIGEAADVVFQADDGLYRVRVGRFATREQAEDTQGRLRLHDVEGSWVASEQPELESPELRLTQGDRQWRVPGRWVELRAQSGGGISILNGRYRGDVLVFLNERGTLNLINRVSVDDYLRGVVPREMGPAVYNNLDALKAQAVAARTYTLRNLGEFSSEGYDICATPRCQVYGGMADEHDLSDRAVLETSGQVLTYEGALADALYSAACGGHTEDVEVVFPLKLHPYLRGVPCPEAGAKSFGRKASGARSLAAEVVAALLRRGGETRSPAEFAARTKALAIMSGRTGATGGLGSFERREIRDFLDPLLETGDLRTLGLEEERPSRVLRRGEIDRTLLGLAILLGVVEQEEQGFLAASDSRLWLRGSNLARSWSLAGPPPTYRSTPKGLQQIPLKLMPGDRLNVFTSGERVLAVVQGEALEASVVDASWKRGRGSRPWNLFRADRELAALIDQRYPQLGFAGLEIRSRGVSGRVAELRILGTGGESVDVSGLPIRWTLDLPDTLFTAKRLNPAGGEAGWQFNGRGWGHGVGMCQIGAFGMALRGNNYRDILDHYYTGLEIVTLTAGESRARSDGAFVLDNRSPSVETE